MKMRAMLASTLLVAVVALGALGVTGAAADPNLGFVPAHRHYVRQANGARVQVGPRVCDNPNLQAAFQQFHNNIHAVTPTGIGQAAPGLHDGKGADITFGPCFPILS